MASAQLTVQGRDKIFKFAVVEFLGKKEVELVAGKWLFKSEKKEEMVFAKAYWPPIPSKKCRAYCVKQVDADEKTWKIFEVRVLYRTDDLAKAITKLVMSEYTSDLESAVNTDDGQEPGSMRNNKPKRTSRLPQRYIGSDNDDSGDEFGGDTIEDELNQPAPTLTIPLPPKVPQALKSRKRLLSPAPRTSEPIHTDTCLEQLRKYARIGDSQSTPPPPTPSPSRSTPRSALDFKSPSSPAVELPKSLAELAQEVRRIRIDMVEAKNEARATRKMVAKILEIVSKTPTPNEEEPLPQELPMAAMEDFDEMEGRLESKAFARNLAIHLSKFGAPDVKKATRCILEATMTFTLMAKFNWKGQRGVKVSMENKRLVSVIYAAVLHNKSTKDCTVEEIKGILKDHIRYADKRVKKPSATRAKSLVDAKKVIEEEDEESDSAMDSDY